MRINLLIALILLSTIPPLTPALTQAENAVFASRPPNGEIGSSNPSIIRTDSELKVVVFTERLRSFYEEITDNTRGAMIYMRESDSLSLVSRPMDDSVPNETTGDPNVSEDGRYVIYCSSLNNLVEDDTNPFADGFIYDIEMDTTKIFTYSKDGEALETSGCLDVPSISNDGSIVAYRSFAPNVVENDTNLRNDIFVTSVRSNQNSRVSVSSEGEEANGDSEDPDISGDGRYVVFSSNASSLTAITKASGFTTYFNIFLHDRVTRETTLITKGIDLFPGNRSSSWPRISNDGNYVVFSSGASNLVDETDSTATRAYLYDRANDSITLISKNLDGSPATGIRPYITGDGKYIVYYSASSEIVENDTNETLDVFLYNRLTRTTQRISVSTNGEELDRFSAMGAINDAGTYAAFLSRALNMFDETLPEPSSSYSPLYISQVNQCPNDVSKLTEGLCGCGVSEADLNANGNADCIDPLANSKPDAPTLTAKRKRVTVEMQPYPGANVTYKVSMVGRTSNGKRIRRKKTTTQSSTRLKGSKSVKRWRARYTVTAGTTKTKKSKRGSASVGK